MMRKAILMLQVSEPLRLGISILFHLRAPTMLALWISILLLGLLLWSPASAATIAAASCSSADVSNAYNSTVNGDTLAIPPGACTWSSTLTVSKNITIQGAGAGTTTSCDPALHTCLTSTASTNTPLLRIQPTVDLPNRVTGINF